MLTRKTLVHDIQYSLLPLPNTPKDKKSEWLSENWMFEKKAEVDLTENKKKGLTKMTVKPFLCISIAD